MNLKTISSFILSVLIGILCGSLVLSQYKHNVKNVVTYPLYMIQQGVYSTEESMEENTFSLSDYMYIKQDDKYYVYLGVSSDIDVANKIKDNYDMDLYIKENVSSDEDLVHKIKANDDLIKEDSSKVDILSYSKKSLEIYEGQMNVVHEY